MNIRVTKHAIERYCERVANVTQDAAVAALSGPTIQKAVQFGARHVILGGGQRVVIEQGRIITVLPKAWSKGCVMKQRGFGV
jgi:hypothetical protein